MSVWYLAYVTGIRFILQMSLSIIVGGTASNEEEFFQTLCSIKIQTGQTKDDIKQNIMFSVISIER